MAAQTREFPITFTMTNMESIVVIATPAGSETVFVVMSSSQSVTHATHTWKKLFINLACSFFVESFMSFTRNIYITSTFSTLASRQMGKQCSSGGRKSAAAASPSDDKWYLHFAEDNLVTWQQQTTNYYYLYLSLVIRVFLKGIWLASITQTMHFYLSRNFFNSLIEEEGTQLDMEVLSGALNLKRVTQTRFWNWFLPCYVEASF